MPTLVKRYDLPLVLTGSTTAYPEMNTPLDDIFSSGVVSPVYGVFAPDSIEEFTYGYFDDEKYIGAIWTGVTTLKFQSAFTGEVNFGYYNNGAVFLQGNFTPSSPSIQGINFIVQSASENNITVNVSLSEYDAPVALTNEGLAFGGTSLVTNFSDNEIQLPISFTFQGAINKVNTFAATFDGSNVDIFNAFQLDYPDYSGITLLGDKYSGSNHVALLAANNGASYELMRMYWAPETYVDGIMGTFNNSFDILDFDDAALNILMGANELKGIDFGNDNEYVLVSNTYQGTVYLILIAKDFSYYDLYTLSSSDAISDQIFFDYTEQNWDGGFIFNQNTGNLIMECGPAPTQNYAFVNFSAASNDSSVTASPIRVPLNCSNFCLPFLKEAKKDA